MVKPYIITALDIGSDSVKILSVLKKPGEPDFEILGEAKEAASGIRRGVVINPLAVGDIISSLAKKVEENCGKKITNVYASVEGGHIFSASSRGLVSVSRADQKISEEDISRVIQAAQTISLPPNKEILEVFPKEFIVDGEGGIKEAVGLEGVRLESEVLILCGFSPYLRNSSQAVLASGLQLNDLIPAPLASSRAALKTREKELGVCLLDIGAGTTGMSVFEEGALIHTAVFPVGSGHITNDIAICLKTDIDTAEKIKLEFGSCRGSVLSDKKSDKNGKKIRIEGEEPLVFSKKTLTKIIGARVSEIFDLTNKELKKISCRGRLPGGAVLTGGGARIPGIKELAKKELKLPCRLGAPTGHPAFKEDPDLSTLYGIILEAIDLEESGGKQPNSKFWIISWLKKAIKALIP